MATLPTPEESARRILSIFALNNSRPDGPAALVSRGIGRDHPYRTANRFTLLRNCLGRLCGI
jgi:hypothetical protein